MSLDVIFDNLSYNQTDGCNPLSVDELWNLFDRSVCCIISAKISFTQSLRIIKCNQSIYR